jgi:hypothetical protein
MKYRLCFLCIVILTNCRITFSQTVFPEIFKKYDASVVSRIFELNRYNSLDRDQQITLAALLHQKDSMVMTMIGSGKPFSLINKLTGDINNRIYNLPGLTKYRDTASAVAMQLAAQSELKYYDRYKPSNECRKKIKALVDAKYSEFTSISQSYPATSRARDSLENIVRVQQDSLIETELMKDGSFISSGQFTVAVKFRKMLGLSDVQTDSLITMGMFLEKMRDSAFRSNPLYPYDAKDFENTNMSRILTDKQYEQLLGLKYRTDAQKNAENDWKDLDKRGLTKDMNKEATMMELTMYYTRLKSSSCMYAFDLDKQSAYMRSVKDHMPKALRMLQYARKNNITAANLQSVNNQW